MLKTTSENEPGSRMVDRAGLEPKWGQVQHVKEKKEGDSSPRPTRVGLPVPKPKRVQDLTFAKCFRRRFFPYAHAIITFT